MLIIKSPFSDQPDNPEQPPLMQNSEYKRLYEALYNKLAYELYDDPQIQLDVADDQVNDFAYMELYQCLYKQLSAELV